MIDINEKLRRDYTNGYYINAKVSASSAYNLSIYSGRLARSLQIYNDSPEYSFVGRDEYHCTICYSKTKIDYSPTDIYPFKTSPTRYEIKVLGKSDGPKVIVLALGDPRLIDRNRELTELGATSDFAYYQPHITLIAGLPVDYSLDIIPTKPDFEIEFTSEQVQPLNPEFSYSSKSENLLESIKYFYE